MSDKLTDRPLPQRDADHTAKVIVETLNGPQTAWLQLFLSKHEDDTPFFRVVSDNYRLRLQDSHLWKTFEGTAPLSLGAMSQTYLTIQIRQFIWQKRYERHIAQERVETTFWAIPIEFVVIKKYSARAEGATKLMHLSLSPNPVLDPGPGFTRELDGQRTIWMKHKSQYKLSDELTIEIDKRFDWQDDEGDSSFPRLVADMAGDIYSLRADSVSPQFKDATLLLSFLTATRTVISRLTSWHGGTTTDYYLPRLGFPEQPLRMPFRFGLVKKGQVAASFEIAWIKWCDAHAVEPLRQAVLAFVPGQSQLVTMEFLRLFAAIEGLVNAYCQGDDPSAPQLISKSTHRSALIEFRTLMEERGLKADELKPLNGAIDYFAQPSLRDKFDQYRKRWQVDVDDLWPMFNSDRSSLSHLRNRIIHGGDLPDELEKAIWHASNHLVFILARCLLRVLGLQVDETEVHYPQSGGDLTMFSELKRAMETAKKLD